MGAPARDDDEGGDHADVGADGMLGDGDLGDGGMIGQSGLDLPPVRRDSPGIHQIVGAA